MNSIIDLNALADLIADRVVERLAANNEHHAPSMLTVTQAAEYLHCKPQRIYDLTSQGRLTQIKDGSRSLIRKSDLDQYLESETTKRNT